jgi:hypothetical protein
MTNRPDRPLWDKLAAAWGLPVEAMPDALHHLRARLLAERGQLELTSYEVRYDGTERRWYTAVDPTARLAPIVTTRPAPWNPVREDQALRALQGILGERLDFTQ